jgi:hypothetical protein
MKSALRRQGKRSRRGVAGVKTGKRQDFQKSETATLPEEDKVTERKHPKAQTVSRAGSRAQWNAKHG